MHISFENKSIRSICEVKQAGIDELGEVVAQKLRTRLQELIDVVNIYELLAGNPTIVGDSPFEHLQVELTDNYVILSCACDQKKYYLENGSLDWSRVKRIKLLKIEKSDEQP